MKRGSFPFVILFMFAIGTVAEAEDDAAPAQGKVTRSETFLSTILGRDVKYSVYLPPDYGTSARRYPVPYFLHGAGNNECTWIDQGKINVAADREIALGKVPPMIVIMPDGGLTWFINNYNNTVRYEDMFIKEFVPHIDRTYRTLPKARGIAGLSMGGYGAMSMAMRHPDMFPSCVAFSSGIRTEDQLRNLDERMYEKYFAEPFGPRVEGNASLLSDHYKRYSPVRMAATLPEDRLRTLRLYVDCGDEDQHYKGHAALHVILRDRNIPHEYRIRDGRHNWSYWRSGLGNALRFLAGGFPAQCEPNP